MSHMKNTDHSSRKPSGRNKTRSLRKRQKRHRLCLLALIIFILGFFSGFFLGSSSREVLGAVSLPSHEQTQKAENEKKVQELPWNLTLVNFKNELSADFEPAKLTELTKEHLVDSRMAAPAREMLNAAKADGIRIICVSAYRSYERQTELYENKVKRLQKANGYSIKKAREEAGMEVAFPGTSEHQLGLALDLTDASYTGLDEKQQKTPAYQWLSEHCHEYGFIVRYPADKTEITGIIYEPWHFRYVGIEAAKEIKEQGLTLEEYVNNI